MSKLSDLELTRACAEMMKYEPTGKPASEPAIQVREGIYAFAFDPLNDDAQAMALVKKFRLDISGAYAQWQVCKVRGDFDGTEAESMNPDLNRAICECVAKLKETV